MRTEHKVETSGVCLDSWGLHNQFSPGLKVKQKKKKLSPGLQMLLLSCSLAAANRAFLRNHGAPTACLTVPPQLHDTFNTPYCKCTVFLPAEAGIERGQFAQDQAKQSSMLQLMPVPADWHGRRGRTLRHIFIKHSLAKLHTHSYRLHSYLPHNMFVIAI